MTAGNIVVTPDFQNPYYTITPPSLTHTFSGVGEALNADFCIEPNGVHHDVEISIIPLNAAQPGFNAYYRVEVYNKGTQPMSGSVDFNFNGGLMDFVSSNPSGLDTANSVNWTITNLAPLERRSLNVTLNINAPTETPAVNIGDVLIFNAIVTSSAVDETIQDNTANLYETVVGSYDPNDKLVMEGNQITPSQTDDYLHYTVRFQNSGTAPAVNVVIDDYLEENLDPTTIEVLASSHPMHATRSENKLQFFYEDINLPAQSVDEPGSHGFVTFKVKPAPSVVLGSVIENKAEIFFDFNYPIVTNTTSTTVVQSLSTNFPRAIEFSIYPNPTNGSVTFDSRLPITKISIYNAIGQLIKSITADEMSVHSDISALRSGVYLVEVTTAQGKAVRKLMKFE
jgi:uncharacterized repeat protein (TIGR01451 family)